jgi:RES domain-containing protein
MFADYRPETPNKLGARWNPPDVLAVYTSLERATALAEADYRVSIEPFRITAKRRIFRLDVKVLNVLDLRSPGVLGALGVDKEELGSLKPRRCPQIGGDAAWLGHDGIIVPSARHPGANLVIYLANLSTAGRLDVMDSEALDVQAPRRGRRR